MFQFGKRILLLLAMNVLVILTISLILHFFQIQPYLTHKGLNLQSLAIYSMIWGFTGAFISLLLSKVMAKWMMGVTIIDPQNASGEERMLVETVRNLAQNAGLSSTPEVGIYEGAEVNAFATGPSRNHSLIAVSRGLLKTMSPSALQGVLAHEMTHITNGDMVTMTLLQGVINSFVLFASRIIGYAIASRRDDEGERNYALQHMISFVAEIILSFLGMILLAGFSRWREYRADAGAARITSPHKMIEALQTLKFISEQRGFPSSREDAFASLKINGGKGFLSLFATHPPLEDRIQRLQEGSF